MAGKKRKSDKRDRRDKDEWEEFPMTRATRWLPIFIIILLVVLVIVYLQSTKITVPESQPSANELDHTSQEVSEEIEKSAEDILEAFPSMKMTVSSLKEDEEFALKDSEMPSPKTAAPKISSDALDRILQKKKDETRRAVEFVEPDGFINTDSVWISDLVGEKVIAVVFWTSSSINCLRQLENTQRIYDIYHPLGLEIVAVHTPEFGFEGDRDVVESAVQRAGVSFPIVMDNDFYTWRAYENKFWPTVYLIGIDGFIRDKKIGEAGCEEAEKSIQELLRERSEVLDLDINVPSNVQVECRYPDFSNIKTPAIYLGYAKNRGNFGSPEGFAANLPVSYSIPETLIPNSIYLEGEWFNHKESMGLLSDLGRSVLRYTAKDVYMVAGGDASVTVFIDGQEVKDFQTSEPRLYSLYQGHDYKKHTLKLDIESLDGPSGSDDGSEKFRLYSFSFG